MIYVYVPGPLIGGLIAVFFHEFVYKKVQETIQETEEVDGILDKQSVEESKYEDDEWVKSTTTIWNYHFICSIF